MQDLNEAQNILQQVLQQIDETIVFTLNNKILELLTNKKKFVHYTSAIVAREIIEKEQLWLRKTLFMNDYSEIIYGKQYIDKLLNNPEITIILNNILEPITNNNNNLDIIKETYHKIISNIEKKIYISCLSEHLPEENTIGRLSMWRAYGNSSGIALVINPKLLVCSEPLFNILPVIYSKENSKKLLKIILKNIENIIKNNLRDIQNLKDTQNLKDFSENILYTFSYIMYIYVITLKHQGFWEEREWRIILSLLFSDIETTIPKKFVERSIENIKGTPEVIYKLNLKNFSFINPNGESLLEKIIIGPTANSEILVESFSEVLRNKGFDDKQVENMITVSNIPLRY